MSNQNTQKRPHIRRTPEECYAAIDSFYEKNHRAPSAGEMNTANGLPSPATFHKTTGTTPKRYLDEKFKKPKDKPSKKRVRIDVDKMISDYRRFYEEHGRMPQGKELKENHLPCLATFKRVTGESPAAYIKRLAGPNKKENLSNNPNVPTLNSFILEIVARMGISVNDLALKTGLSVQRIHDLLDRDAPKEFVELYSIANTLKIPMELLFRVSKPSN